MKNKKITLLTEGAVMLGLATALSMLKVMEMPMGGSITVLSMLPIVLISVKYGIRFGLCVSFLYSTIQLGLGIGEVMTWGLTPAALGGTIALDYLLPFTLLGFAGIFRKKSTEGWFFGIELVMIVRFICHIISGVIIFGQWTPEDMSPLGYSVTYNSAYMFPELIFTSIGAYILLKAPEVRKLFRPVDVSDKNA